MDNTPVKPAAMSQHAQRSSIDALLEAEARQLAHEVHANFLPRMALKIRIEVNARNACASAFFASGNAVAPAQ